MRTLVVLIFSLYTGCFSTPVLELKVPNVFVYKYTAHIDTFTTADQESLARWTVSGTLTQKRADDDITIIQLSDVKTSVFNGHKDKLQNVEGKPIPKEAKILEQPFTVNLKNFDNYTMYFKANEPKWSINMKKAMLNFLNMDYEKPTKEFKFVSPTLITERESTLYGNCLVTYKRISASIEDGVVYEREVDNCTQIPMVLFTNSFRDPGMQDLQEILDYNNTNRNPGMQDLREILDYKNTKTLILKIINGYLIGESLVAKSNIWYKNCKSCKYTQNIYQEQSLVYVDAYTSDETHDVSEYTEERLPLFEVETSPDLTSGRHVYEKDSSVIAQKFIDMYDEYAKNTFSYGPPDYYNISKDDVSDMYLLLMNSDLQSLKAIEDSLKDREDKHIGYFYITLLSYIGSDSTVEYLTKYLQNKNADRVAPFASRILMNFPRYIFLLSDEMLAKVEPLLRHQAIVDNEMMRKAAYFGFSSGVGRACRQNKISKKYKQKYIDMFNNKFLEDQDYEERMVNLLALINMGECLDFDFMSAIATNTSESRHLRLLALSGFKEHLTNTNVNSKLYDVYWPIVQKKSEPFEVRVAILDLLLYNIRNEEQFNSIIQRYSGDLNEPDDRQMANYVLTVLHSGCMAEFRDNNNIHPYPKNWATGLYRLSVKDSKANVGSYLESRIITDPKTNVINFAQISFNSFALSYDLGTYIAYIKFEGLSEVYHIKRFLNRHEASSLPELVKLLKDFNYNIGTINDDIHIDIVIFVYNTAVYVKHFDTFGLPELKQLGVEFEDMMLEQQYLQYPVIQYIQIPSDLGTPIMISSAIQNVAKWEGRTHEFRNSWSHQNWMEVYNPLLDTYIANYKYHNEEIYARLNISFNKAFPPKLTWYNEEDTFSMTWDKNMGTGVEDEEILHQYCEDCKTYTEVPTENHRPYTLSTEAGFDVVTETWSKDPYSTYANVLMDFMENKKHRSCPFATPFLFVANTIQYQSWVENDLAKGSIKTKPSQDFKNSTQSSLVVDIRGSGRNGFSLSQFDDIAVILQVKDLNEQDVKAINMTMYTFWSPIYSEDNETENYGIKMVSFDIRRSDRDTSKNMKVCGYGDVRLPVVRSDRLSLLPYEPVTFEIVVVVGTGPESDEDDCDPDNVSSFKKTVQTYTITQIYAPNDKKAILENEKSLKDYEQCQKDSKDLKYTAPTTECRRISNRLTENGNYKLYVEAVRHFNGKNETIFEKKNPWIEYYRSRNDRIVVKINVDKNLQQNDGYFSQSVYYPGIMFNQLRMGYNDDDSAIPQLARSVCTITPSRIEQFSGKFVPNEKKKWLAFGECYNTTTRALQGHTIDDKHVGFTYHSYDKVVEGTVKNGKVHVTLNSKPITAPITEFVYAEDFSLKIYFLDDDVIMVVDVWANAEFYYNTEYIAIRVNPMYSTLLCGVCN